MTTVAELIATLQQQPPDAMVLVDGYEGGFDDPIVKWEDVVLDKPYPHGGEHSKADRWDVADGAPITRVLVVSRDEPL